MPAGCHLTCRMYISADARRPASELTRATNHALMAGASLAGRRRAAGAPIGGRAGGLARTVAGSGGAAIDTDRGGRRHAAAVHEYNEATVWSVLVLVACTASAAYPTAYYKYIVRRSSRPVCTCVCHVSIRYAYV